MNTAALPNPLPPDIRLMNQAATLLAVLAVVGFVAAGAAWLVRLPLFAIHGVRIEGEVARNNATTIRANALPKLGGTFFTLDMERAKAAFESVPWVRTAVVRRIFPNRLAVKLEEHRAAALWQAADGSDRLVNTQGEVFDANLGDVEDEGLATLAGPDGSSARMLAMLRRLEPLVAAAPLEAGIETLALSGRGSWRVELDSGADIEIGRGADDEIVERLQRFLATLPQVTAQYERPLVFADLRHRDGYAVKLRNVVTTPDAKPEPKSRKKQR